MISFQWINADGEPLARVSQTWTLTRDDLAGLLISSVVPATHDELADMPKAEIEREIRNQLANHAEQRHWWQDNYSDQYDREATQDEVWAWAVRQIDRLMRRSKP